MIEYNWKIFEIRKIMSFVISHEKPLIKIFDRLRIVWAEISTKNGRDYIAIWGARIVDWNLNAPKIAKINK